jgi:hypothetical protein
MKSVRFSRIDGGEDILANKAASFSRKSASSLDNFPFFPAVASLLKKEHHVDARLSGFNFTISITFKVVHLLFHL